MPFFPIDISLNQNVFLSLTRIHKIHEGLLAVQLVNTVTIAPSNHIPSFMLLMNYSYKCAMFASDHLTLAIHPAPADPRSVHGRSGGRVAKILAEEVSERIVVFENELLCAPRVLQVRANPQMPNAASLRSSRNQSLTSQMVNVT